MTNVLPAAGIVALLGAQDPTRLVTLKEQLANRRTLRESGVACQQRQRRTCQTAKQPLNLNHWTLLSKFAAGPEQAAAAGTNESLVGEARRKGVWETFVLFGGPQLSPEFPFLTPKTARILPHNPCSRQFGVSSNTR